MARYTDEEAREILRRAIDSDEARRDGLSDADLVEAAQELGIAPEHVERAAIEVREQAAVDARRRERRRRERERFVGSLATYAVVNGFLALLDYMTGIGWWVQWPMLIWGLFLALHAVSLWSPKQRERRDQKAERRYRRQVERERRRRAREKARRARASAESEFEQAVERGVAALLGAAARSLDELVPGGEPRRDSEFGRYVERRRRGGRARATPPAGSPPSGPRARVEVSEPAGEEEPVETDRDVTSRRSRNPR